MFIVYAKRVVKNLEPKSDCLRNCFGCLICGGSEGARVGGGCESS